MKNSDIGVAEDRVHERERSRRAQGTTCGGNDARFDAIPAALNLSASIGDSPAHPEPRTLMPVRFHRFIPALALVVGACGFFGGEEAPDSTTPDSTGTVTATAPSGDTAWVSVASGPPTDLEGLASADSAQTAAATDSSGQSPADAATGAAPTAGVAAAQAQDAGGSLEERLERIIAGQEAINLRLDSLVSSDTVTTVAENAVQSGQEVLGEARDRVRNFGVGVIWSIIVLVLCNSITPQQRTAMGPLSGFVRRLPP